MAFLYHLCCFLGVHLPLKLLYFIAKRVADIQYLYKKGIRQGVKSNIRQVLTFQAHQNGKSLNERLSEKYVKESFYNFARYAAEFSYLPKINKNNLKKFITIKGKRYLDQALAKGRGVVSITAHLGNWELGGVVTTLLGYPVNAVALPHKTSERDRIFVERRKHQGVKVIPWGKELKKIIRALAKNEIVALLGDRLIGEQGILIEFFGRKTKIPKGPAALALKMNCPIVPGFLIRIKEGRFLLIFEPPILPTKTDDREKDLEELARRALGVVEKYILAYPSQWLNFQPLWPKG